MQPVLIIQSSVKGILVINGVFCGPLEAEGQAFPAGREAEIYIQLFPFGVHPPLTAALQLSRGRMERLEPQDGAFALLWPDGLIQLELCVGAAEQTREEPEAYAAGGTLLRCLAMRLAGDPQAERLMLRAQDLPPLEGYEAAVPLQFAPMAADGRWDERAGLVRRIAPNAAAVDAVLAATVPVGQGMKRIERMEILKTQG